MKKLKDPYIRDIGLDPFIMFNDKQVKLLNSLKVIYDKTYIK